MEQIRTSRPIPLDSLVFGYGPMLPFVLAAIGAWVLEPHWSAIVIVLGAIWGAMILVFVGAVRRGFGFDRPHASLGAAITMMLVYFVLGGLALVTLIFVSPTVSLGILIGGFVIVPLADSRAAHAGNAPPYFASLRPPQMAIATIALIVMIARILDSAALGATG